MFTNQVRVEVAAAKERFAKKQEKTDEALAILMDGLAKLIEMGTQDDGNWRRRRMNNQERWSVDWADRRELINNIRMMKVIRKEEPIGG